MGRPAPKPQVSGRANLVNLELALHPVSWSLPYWDSAGILGPSRDPGTGQGSWDWTGILGPGRDPGTWQGSWNWTGILGLDRDPGTWQGSWDWTGILELDRNPGTGQGSWDLAGILGPDRDPGTCRDPGTWQESWDWTGILGLDRDLFQGGAGKRQSWYLVFNVLIVAKKLLKDDRWVPGVVLVVDAAAVSL